MNSIHNIAAELSKRMAQKRDDLIVNAINYMMGEGWKSEDVKERGQFVRHIDSEVDVETFVFDGIPLIEFHGFDTRMEPGVFKAEVTMLYRELYLE